ncbi:hypothetical protein [Arenimonas donghaensis]|uniref:Uncharacterized protein n=1 Tax=Arenimonas donghaensis DSM 18148 = HO3-R19 TaxID=1121014 RepID=A0A087MKD7_9GAMM|nr:hypothetical protein [Arenimonas donghaensis]KFL37340.1 hypothetical protein N788_10090 [Arenimonas donghaensis DSM 18148 = HO3-R19]
MKARTLILALAASLTAAPVLADDTFRSPPVNDALAAGRAAMKSARLADPAATKAAPTAAEVGDADSFGRKMNWLGLLSGFTYLQTDCVIPGEPLDPRCIQLNPAPAFTSFEAPDLAAITLPGKSTDSLLCHWQTPIVSVGFANFTAAPEQYRFQAFPVYRIESEVLDGLSDPFSGTPYNGAIELGLSAINVSGSIGPGEYNVEQFTFTRMCIGGLVSKQSLINSYGLTEAQAKQFFKKPITITMSIRGNARMVDAANINFGTRFAGD